LINRISGILVVIVILFFSIFDIQAQKLSDEKLKYYNQIADEIISSSLNERKGYELLRELCEIGPRLSGSENSLKAISWAENKMKDAGFDSVWLQPVMVPHWERGDVEKAVIIESKYFTGKELNIAALGGSIATPPNGITAEVIEIRSFEELKEQSENVKGKIVFFSQPFDQSFVNTFSGYSNAVKKRSEGAIEASKHGAVGVIVRSITTKFDNQPHVGGMRYSDTIPKIPSVAAGYLDSDFLSEAIKKEPGLKINLKLNCQTFPDAQSYNVIADLKGTEKPDEIVIVSGHLDSWDLGCGAHDDGGGCIQAFEVLDLLKRLDIKTKRTIRCIFYINEENGVRGGIEYAKYAENSSEIHLAAIESDRGVFTPRGFTVDADSSIIEKMQPWLPVLNKAQINHIIKGYGGVDIYYLRDNVKAKIGYEPDAQRYFDLHHSANDVFEEVHPREMQLGTAAITLLTLLLSEEGL
jgi:carboxypeptidase Q